MDQFDRLPPSAVDAEMCLLGSIVLGASMDRSLMPTVLAMVTRDSFFQPDHQIIFSALSDLYRDGHAIDAVSLTESLRRRQLLDEVGGVHYLSRIIDSVPSYAHYATYAGIVREKAIWRNMIELGNEVIRKAYAASSHDNATAAASELAAKASRISMLGSADEVVALETVLHEVLDGMGTTHHARIGTGLGSLDAVIGGLRRGGKTIVGARPSMGKSALLKQIAKNIAERGVAVGIISIEEHRKKIGENLISNQAGVPNNRIAHGRLAAGEMQAITKAVGQLSSLPVYIVDSARKLSRIVAAAHRLVHQHKCQVVIVDHLHIIDGETDEVREREMSKISGELKWCWKDLDVAGVEAAQLNRKSGKERPTLDSLRDSGSLEQDGDTIILLHREDYFRRDEEPKDNILEADVAKNKDGATAVVPLHFDMARQRITDAEVRDPFADEHF